jgi:fatty acid desaturase
MSERRTFEAIRRGLRAFVDGSARRSQRRDVARHPASDGGDYAALKAAVKARGLLTPQPGYYAAVSGLCAALVVGSAAWASATRATALLWLAAPVLAFASGQLTLLGHEAAHHAIVRGARGNDALARLYINLLNGGNFRWWAGSHNEHHARSNERDDDPDIDYPFFAFSDAHAAQKAPVFRPLLTRQHWLALPLMGLVGVTLRVYSLAYYARRGGSALDLAATATFYVVYLALTLGGLGLARGAAFIALHQCLFGMYLGTVTAINHWGMPMLPRGHGLGFLRQQVTTARNLRGGAFADLWFGGLNRQIEHHLFPTMPRSRLREAAPLVRDFCAARGIAYHEVTIAAGYRELFATLRRVATGARAAAPHPTVR